MPLQPGMRLGAYEVVGAIGIGGMGEVYRAHDTRLHRDVAIKVLPELFASDPDRLSRFEREAHLLASLNHPHIAHVYGLEKQDGPEGPDRQYPFIVMEFVEGPTLADRLAHGRIPLDEALPIARQIADALESAHEQGIIHRDLKPANIKVKDDGTVKVLDFGLAKALDAGTGVSGKSPGAARLSMSPTMISPAQMTHVGIILGTAAYMAPEQAKGRRVDKRADIWAFGCVLFEMLTGKPTFGGETVTETLAAVMRDSPTFAELPADTPRRVRRLLERCLERDPRQRWRDIGDVRIELDARDPEQTFQAAATTGGSRLVPIAAATALLAASIASAIAWRLKPTPLAPLRKFDLALSAPIAELSADGSRIAYAAGEHLFVRDLAAAEARDLGPLSQETNRIGWSPDGTIIFTTSRDGKVRTIPARGGAPLVVCDIPESRQTIGAVWIGDDLVFAVWRGGLYRVSARGGTPRVWLAIDEKKEIDFHALGGLPDGRVVFATHQIDNDSTIEIFDGTKREMLLPSVASAADGTVESGMRSGTDMLGTVGGFWYSPTGHLLFTRSDSNAGLWAVPFGHRPIDIRQSFLVAPGATSASVANDGTLMVHTGSDAAVPFELVALDRHGQGARVLVAAAAEIASPAVSPDGRRVAIVMNAGGQRQVWVQDTASATGTRLTFEDEAYAHPAWFPTGNRLIYSGHAMLISGTQVFAVAGDGSGTPQRLVLAHRAEVSPDSHHIVYSVDERGANHLRYGQLDADVGAGQRVFKGDAEPDVRDFALSPDGGLLAYVDYRSGRGDLLLTRYPTAEGRWQVFANGGRPLWGSDDSLRWARLSHELFFIVANGAPEGGRMMAVTVRADAGAVTVGQPAALFDVDADALVGGFDVSPDGKTFYLRRRAASQPKKTGPRFTLIQNWMAEFVH